jgi:hypothetical protein
MGLQTKAASNLDKLKTMSSLLVRGSKFLAKTLDYFNWLLKQLGKQRGINWFHCDHQNSLKSANRFRPD